MTALSISPPFPIFSDRDGQPLENGYVWIGTANLPAITNPIAVFWDVALTQPAAQPIRTINGYPSNNGTPAVVYANSDYSLLVQDSNGSMVYSAPAITFRPNLNAANVVYQPGGAGAVPTDVQASLRQRISAFDFMTPAQVASVQARDLQEDVTGPLQAFFDACRGKRGHLPAGTYKKSAQITLDPQYSYDIEGDGWSSEYSEQGTIIKDTTNCNGLFIYYTLANYPGGPPGGGYPNSDNLVRLAQFRLRGPSDFNLTPGSQTIGIEGVNTSVATGAGIWMYWMNHLRLEDFWIDGYVTDGVYGYRCFSAAFKNVWSIRNNRCGVHLYNTANDVHFFDCKILANVLVPLPDINCGILIDGASGFENLGPIFSGATDVSYNGQAGVKYNVSAGTLTSIVVVAGTATINASAHKFNVGDRVAIFGATAGDAQINTIDAATVLTKATNSFTVATTAADGTYNQSALSVGPYAAGIGIDRVQGGRLGAYSEENTGPGVYVFDNVRGFRVDGGYWLQDKIFVKAGARGGVIQGGLFTGIESGVYLENEVSALVGPHSCVNDFLRGTPTSYIGGLPFRENGSMILQGMTIGRGADFNIGPLEPGPVTSTAMGVGALINANTSGGAGQGRQNTAIGYYALNASTSGYNNTALGRHAGLALTTGYENVAVGNRAMDTGTNIQACVFVGNAAGSGMSSGANDVYVGIAAGVKASPGASGGNNTGLGSNALRVDGSQDYKWCTIVGGQTAPMTAATGMENYTGIGYDTYSFAASNKVRAGNAAVTAAHVQVAWTVTSDRRLKRDIADLDLGLALVNALRPVSFRRTNGDDTEELGFIAQEVEAVLPRPLGLLSVDVDDTYMLRKDDLIAVLVKAVQELSAQVKELQDARA